MYPKLIDHRRRLPAAQLTLDDRGLSALRLRVLHDAGNKQRVAPFSSRCARELRR